MRQILPLIIEIVGVLAVLQILSISPAIQLRRPVNFTQPQREGQAALSLAVLIILLIAIMDRFMDFPLQSMGPFAVFNSQYQLTRPEPFGVKTLILQTGLMAIIAIPFLYSIIRRKQPWLSVGLKQQMIKGGLQVGFGLVLISIFLRNKIVNLIYGTYTLDTLLLFIGSLISCFVLELIFRGFVQLRLMAWLGDTIGWLIASSLYALWSVMPILGMTSDVIISTIIYRLGMGLLLGWVARKSGGIFGGWIYNTVHTWLFWIV